MPGTLTPSQMFDHMLNPQKGWPSPYAVDKRVQADTGVTGILAGMCLYVDPTTGLAHKGTVNGYMGLFVFQNQNDFDVNGDVGNIISNNLNCLVANGAYELETTEYSGSAFQPNDPLTSAAADGRLIVGDLTDATQNIVGVVSETGPVANAYGKNCIRFWPVYCPARALA